MENKVLSLIISIVAAALLGSALMTPSVSQGALPPRCELAFSGHSAWKDFDPSSLANDQRILLSALKGFAARAESEIVMGSRFLPSPEETLQLLNDQESPVYGQTLRDVVHELMSTSFRTPMKPETASSKFIDALTTVFKRKGFSSELINPRVNAIHFGRVADWRVALGDLSLNETNVLYYGRDLAKPSAESLVGKYIAATGAQTRLMTFDTSPESGKQDGPPKLVVAVSQASFDKFHELLISSSNYMTIVGHAAVIRDGSFFDVWGEKKSVRIGKLNEPLPFLLVKTSEAQRLSRYLELAMTGEHKGWNSALKQPWQLDGYCATGGYSCCTHWIGNIPLGDKMVTEYAFPPRWENDPNGVPQIQELKPYPLTDRNKEVAQIWKVPGHEQLADVIGQRGSNLSGEMASPGWLIHTLINRTETERVPLVFWITEDHKEKIPDHPYFHYEHRH